QVVPDGRLVAYTADKGEKLFDLQTGQRGGMGPPITYMLDGKQYITMMGGQGTLGARGAPPAPPAPAAPGTQGAATAAAVAAAGAPGGAAGAPAPGAAGPGAPGPGGPGGFGFGGPVVPPRMLTFVLDGKAPLPGQ